jgi:hypothetical protein
MVMTRDSSGQIISILDSLLQLPIPIPNLLANGDAAARLLSRA